MYYTTLNDAAIVNEALCKGNVKVYYKKFDYSLDNVGSVHKMIAENVCRGVKGLRNSFGDYAVEFVKLYLDKTHVCLGEVKGTENLNDLIYLLQGEIWSPEGEARNLIRDKNLTHTSISSGDMVETENGDLYVLGFGGLEKL